MAETPPRWSGAPFDDPTVRAALELLHEGVYVVDRERRIRFWNEGARRITGWSADEVVTRLCQDNVLQHVDEEGNILCHTSCPLTAAMASGNAGESLIYLRHRDGHRRGVHVRVMPVRDAEGQVVGAVEAFDVADAPERLERLERLAYTDPLTGLANRRYLDQSLQARHQDLARNGWPFAVLLVDVDQFKGFNDVHGYAIGDRVLRMVATSLHAATRPTDTVGRYGGDEFLLILPGLGDAALHAVANRVRALVASSGLETDGVQLQVTVSVGAAIARRGEPLAELLQRADAHLKASKVGGRNRVTTD